MKIKQLIHDLELDSIDWAKTLIRWLYNIGIAFIVGYGITIAMKFLANTLWTTMPNGEDLGGTLAFAYTVLYLFSKLTVPYTKEEDDKDDKSIRRRTSKRLWSCYKETNQKTQTDKRKSRTFLQSRI